jgi:hypothetical protein
VSTRADSGVPGRWFAGPDDDSVDAFHNRAPIDTAGRTEVDEQRSTSQRMSRIPSARKVVEAVELEVEGQP